MIGQLAYKITQPVLVIVDVGSSLYYLSNLPEKEA